MTKATVIVGLGFGDEGKGSIVDFLVREDLSPTVVVRFNGGCQAAHNVITPDGRHHTFAQFGSGSFLSHVRTHLSRFMLVDPFALANEARALQSLGVTDPFERLTIDEHAKIITPFQKAANRLREAARNRRHGSCGMGIGETMADSLAEPPLFVTAIDLLNLDRLREKLERMQQLKSNQLKEVLARLTENSREALAEELTMIQDPEAPRLFAEALHFLALDLSIVAADQLSIFAEDHRLIFEGAQGVLLDEWYGFHPHTTWSTTNTANALRLLKEIDFQGDIERIGILRTYHTRHGAGPFPTMCQNLSEVIPDQHNGTGPWQGQFLAGHFDGVLARYALELCEVDSIALTHIDSIKRATIKQAVAYADKNGVSTSLKVTENFQDLDYQESLGNYLKQVSPVYEALPTEESEFIDVIEEICGVPVSIVSRGPRATDKERRTNKGQEMAACSNWCPHSNL